ncbi:MAG TPA: PBP1A family penicillin-binding protein [Gemmatimonadaceae bacterium]|nr:PBP1A family penicillin-binding protein [Gemmatimonadaceae bacterium]
MALLLAGVAGTYTLDAWLLTCGFEGCPTASEIRGFHPSEGGRIVDEDGRLLGRLAIVRRVNVSLAAVPKAVQEAFIATEDRRFYDHNGLDWRGFARALVRNAASFGVREGFSTITMQVVHNSFLTDRYHGRSLRRKLIELRISRLVERQLTKDQILEHYLNVIYLGNGMNGVEAASRDLFGKHVSDLTLAEGAMLAALPKAPSTYTPRRSPRAALARRNLVLGLMAQQGYITQTRAEAAEHEPLRVAENEWRPSAMSEPSALDAVRAIVDSVLPDVLKEGDVVVHTTLDARLQKTADADINRQAALITRETQSDFGGVRESAQGAYVAMDPATGDIRALVSGRRTARTQRGGFDRALSAHRQPGSAFKPFVYEAALAAGFSPASMVDDDPVEVDIGRTVWRPANYGDEYAGRVTLRRALTLSANAATVKISRAVGEQNVIAAARRNGIVSPLPAVPSIALGAVEVTPLELVTAYAPFANGGRRVRPRLVTRIEAPDGTLLWSNEIQTIPVMDPRDAYEITSMLRSVVDFGTGRTLRDMGVEGAVAGKTGTTNNGADVWFVGYTPSLLAGAWFGYDTPRPLAYNATGGRLAAPAWARIYLDGWRERRGADFPVPDGMVMRVIDPESGMLATEYCPSRVREYFKPGSEPTLPCTLHEAPFEPQMADNGESIGGDVDNVLQSIGKGIGKLRKIFKF